MANTAREVDRRTRELHAAMGRELNGYLHPVLGNDWEVFTSQLHIYLSPTQVQLASRNILSAMQILERNGTIRVGEYSDLRSMVSGIDVRAVEIIDKYTREIAEVRANVQDVAIPPVPVAQTVHPIQEQGEQVEQAQRMSAREPNRFYGGGGGVGGGESEGGTGEGGRGAYADFQPEAGDRMSQEVDDIWNVPDEIYQRDGDDPPPIEVIEEGFATEYYQEVDRGQADGVPRLEADVAVVGLPLNIAQGIEALRGTIGDEIKELDLNRQDILENLLDVYQDESVVTKSLQVRFVGEIGIDTGGLTKDAFSTFWNKAFQTYFRGENSLVPYLSTSRLEDARRVYPILGRILSHSVALTGTFPARLSRCMLYTMIHGNIVEDEESILNDLFLFLTPRERQLTRLGLDNFDSLSDDNINSLLDMFSRYSLTNQPRKETFRQNIINLGEAQLCGSCMMFTTYMKAGIPPSHFETFWKRLSMEELNGLYKVLEPTPEKVFALIQTVENMREEEERVLYFLKDFIFALCPEDLSHFLLFLTGSDTLPQDEPITVLFNRAEGLAMHPVAHTCNNMLELPVGYTSPQELRRDFMNILNNPESYSMSIL